MPKTVPLPNGQLMTFPDEMPWEEIAAKLNAEAAGDPGSAPKKIPAGAGPASLPMGEGLPPLPPQGSTVNRLGAELHTGFGPGPQPPPGMRGAPSIQDIPPLPKNATPAQARAHANARIGKLVRNNLPAIGAAGLSAAGPPGILAGAGLAALGGMGGAAADKLLDAAPAVPSLVNPNWGGKADIRRTAGEDVEDIATEGAIQAGQELGGRAVMAPLRYGASRVYQGLVKPSMPLQREFDVRQVVNQLLEDAVPLTRAGAEKAGRNVGAASETAERLYAAADAAGAQRIHAGPINEAIEPIIGEAQRHTRLGRPDVTPALRARQQAISEGIEGVEHVGNRVGYADVAPGVPGEPMGLRTVPGPPINRLANEGVSLVESQPLKRDAQNIADAAWRAAERGVKDIDFSDRVEMAIAQTMRQLQERYARQVGVPGVAAANQLTQLRIAAEEAVNAAIGRTGNTLALGGPKDVLAAAGGGSMKAMGASTTQAGILAAIFRALVTPSVGSKAAIGAHHIGGLPLPQSASRLLLGLMDDDTAPEGETREERLERYRR